MDFFFGFFFRFAYWQCAKWISSTKKVLIAFSLEMFHCEFSKKQWCIPFDWFERRISCKREIEKFEWPETPFRIYLLFMIIRLSCFNCHQNIIDLTIFFSSRSYGSLSRFLLKMWIISGLIELVDFNLFNCCLFNSVLIVEKKQILQNTCNWCHVPC